MQLGADLGNLMADLLAYVDVATGQIKWTLTAIDPATGEQPPGADQGLLPPNDSTGRGQGYLIYTVKPKSGAATGAPVINSATITFDTQEPIVTNSTSNTVDGLPPASSVSPLPTQAADLTFNVFWSGQDDQGGSGLRDYDVYSRDNGGPWTLWQGGVTETAASFTGEGGHTYDFYSVSRDNAGNVEAEPAQPDATTVVLSPVPSITGQPESRTLCAAASVAFTVTASGAPPLSYQWRKGGLNIDGAVLSEYTISPVGIADAGDYDCVVTNSGGSATSDTAILTVLTSPAIIAHPTGQSVCPGNSATFTVAASGAQPLSYQWRKNGQNISGETSASLTTGEAGSYDCVVTNSCGSATSNAATLTVNTGPVITTQPENQTVCSPATGTFTVEASGTPTPTYQWRKNGEDISGATSASLTTGEAGSYDCVVTNSCGSATSNAATLTVNTAPSSPSPPDGTTGVPVTTALSWTPGVAAASHDLYLWRTSETKPAMPTAVDLPGATYQPLAPLSYETRYFWQVVAQGAWGNSTGDEWSFWTESKPGPAQGRAKKNGDTVTIVDVVVTAAFPDFFYLESDDRACGLRVQWAGPIAVGDRVSVTGIMRTTTDWERYLEPTSLSTSGSGVIDPALMSNKALGGSNTADYDAVTGAGQRGVGDGVGLNNIGLLVTIPRRVTAVGSNFFYVDDGTHARDASIFKGVRVLCGSLAKPASGQQVTVTGISSMMRVRDQVFRGIRPRTQTDIQVVQ